MPAAPENATGELLDNKSSLNYCNLKLSWQHPYDQNGTINMFEIVMKETGSVGNVDESEIIHEVYKIPAKNYQPVYSHTVSFFCQQKGHYAPINLEHQTII